MTTAKVKILEQRGTVLRVASHQEWVDILTDYINNEEKYHNETDLLYNLSGLTHYINELKNRNSNLNRRVIELEQALLTKPNVIINNSRED